MELKMKLTGIVLLLLCCVIASCGTTARKHAVGEPQSETAHEVKVTIVGFTDESNLQNAGAREGDIIALYGGKPVGSIEQLGALKSAAQGSGVEVMMMRDDRPITVTVPKGQLGVYLQEIAPEHTRDADAVIIGGIGDLGWSVGMENSFFGALYRLDESYGQKLSYRDLLGLSGYAFRIHFFDGWCPSSPDATCGKDVGSELLDSLGYEYDVYFVRGKDAPDEIRERGIGMDAYRETVMKSIDAGWPVIAIDLMEVPEWGLITGYQKDGRELFCRTYFDSTEGYDIAAKTPWVLYVFSGKKDVDTGPLYRDSLSIAKELYSTDIYDDYFSGLRATEEWIKALKNDRAFENMTDEKKGEVLHANWWIYYSLSEARKYAREYIAENREKFDVSRDTIDTLLQVYEKEETVLREGLSHIPNPFLGSKLSEWTADIREKQIEILETFLNLERNAVRILDGI
jgi:hypothetical protein